MNEPKKIKRVLSGKVVSSKTAKTIVVLIERKVKHPVYGKYMTRSSKIHAHDEAGVAHEGDLVTIAECRPISRTKRWKLVEVVRTAIKN